MKIKISDMFDSVQDIAPDIQEEKVPVDRVRKKVLEKIQQETVEASRRRRIRKPVLIAVILAAALGLCGFAYAYVRWTGFSYTEGLTNEEKEALTEQASKTSSAAEDSEGNVTYYDEEGNGITLTAEEDEAYREELRKEREQAVQDSTDKVDVNTFANYVPSGITEIPTDETGAFEDFMMGDNHTVILYPNYAESYELSKGDVVTINLQANDTRYLEFGYITAEKAYECETIRDKDFSYEIEILDNGSYYFYIRFWSSNVAEFSNCRITINGDS